MFACVANFAIAYLETDRGPRLCSQGHGVNGQLGLGSTDAADTFTIISGLVDVEPKIISCGIMHSLLLDTENNLYGWGNNSDKQVEVKRKSYKIAQPKLLNLPHNISPQSIIAGGYSSAIIDQNGNVWIWGYNFKTFTQIHELSNIKQLVINGINENGNLLALNSDGQVYCWNLKSKRIFTLAHLNNNFYFVHDGYIN